MIKKILLPIIIVFAIVAALWGILEWKEHSKMASFASKPYWAVCEKQNEKGDYTFYLYNDSTFLAVVPDKKQTGTYIISEEHLWLDYDGLAIRANDVHDFDTPSCDSCMMIPHQHNGFKDLVFVKRNGVGFE